MNQSEDLVLFQDGIYIDLLSSSYNVPNMFNLINTSTTLPDEEIFQLYHLVKDNPLIIKYTEGSFYEKHKHSKIDDNHVGDVILYPPVDLYSQFTGGDLTIHFDDHDFIFSTDNLTEWYAVYLPLEIDHSVSKIDTGTRYSFKFELYRDN